LIINMDSPPRKKLKKSSFKEQLSHGDYTVVVVCPLMVGMSAMRYMLDEEHPDLPSVDGDSNHYTFGSISGHNIAIASLPHGEQGIGAAATVASHTRRTFPSADLRLLVGIGGGVPSDSKDIRLGDVVIGMPDGLVGGFVQYDLGKITVSGYERKGFLAPTPTKWRHAVVRMQSNHEAQKHKISDFISAMIQKNPGLQRYSRPPSERDLLFSADYDHEKAERTCGNCDKARIIPRPRRNHEEPHIFYGVIASGNSVIKDARERDKLAALLGPVLCFEMEAAGLVNDFDCIVIRGIADYADSHKSDDWHRYAAATAAGYAQELLSLFPPVPVQKLASG
jgi:nucleoside phosphorylase